MQNYININSIIDVNQIIEVWSIQEENEVHGIWNLIAYPVLADDSMALIFERKRIDDEDSSICDYRILYYDIHKKLCSDKVVEFSLDNEIVVTVFGREDAFRYVGYSMEMDEYYVDSMIKEDGMRFYIGGEVCRIAAKPTGEIVVGYSCEDNTWSDDVFIKIFSKDGVEKSIVQDSLAISCMDITLDHENSVWYHLFPYNKICKIGKNQVEEYKVELSGFDGFALSKDCKTLIVGFKCGDEYSRLYKMELQDKKYVNPVECRIHMSTDIDDDYVQCFCTEFSCLKSFIAFDLGGIIAVSEI
ncbi:hypothetical protein [Anaerosporobacter sp.]